MEAAIIEFAKRYGMAKAMEYFGLDKQTQNPKYAISLGGMSFDPINAIQRSALSRGINTAFSGNLSGIMGPAAIMGGALMLGRAFDPMRQGSLNYSPNLRGQVDFLSRQDGMLSTNPGTGGLVYGPNSVLAGQNVSSMFGTNNYQKQLDKKIGYFEKRIAQGKKINEEKYEEAKKEKKEYFDHRADVRDAAKTKHGGWNKGPTGKDVHGNGSGSSSNDSGESGFGGFCFDPNTFVQMADGTKKKIKNIQLGDQTKGGEVTGVFQFKAADEIHDYKGVTVAGSHYVKENGKFIMVQDSPISVKIDKIPVVYSLDTTDRRIFINDIEFADYNGDGVAKGFLANAGINVPEFNKEVLRQVAERLI